MKLLTLSFLAIVGLGAAGDRPTAIAPDPIPGASYAPEDAADSLWRAGRVAIADEDWRNAARLFERLVAEHPTSAYAGDALYWQAFALQRLGGSGDLRRAAQALEAQRERYASSATWASGEGPALLARVNGRLARGGDAEAAAAVAEAAAEAAGHQTEAAGDQMEAAAERAAAAAERAAAAQEREAARREREARNGDPMRFGREGDRVPAECAAVVSDERVEALNALMQMNGEQALPVLRRVLARRDPCSEYLRRKAVFIVSQRRSAEASDILADVMRNDPDRATRLEAVFWLSQTDGERAVGALEELLRGATDEELQKRAVFALSQTRNPRAGAILRDFAGRADVPEAVRADAIFWLGAEDGPDHSAFLRELFPTLRDDELRERVVFSLSRRRTPENAAWLLARVRDRQLSAEIRKTALFWASQNGGVDVRELGELYASSGDDRELRGQVIFALSQRRGESAAVDRLIAIARTEQDTELRRQALFWLGQSRDPRAAAVLEEIINKP